MKQYQIRRLHLPKVTEMLPQQIETLRWIAGNHHAKVRLKNGLVVHPDGRLQVDRRVSLTFDVQRDYNSLMERIQKKSEG